MTAFDNQAIEGDSLGKAEVRPTRHGALASGISHRIAVLGAKVEDRAC